MEGCGNVNVSMGASVIGNVNAHTSAIGNAGIGWQRQQMPWAPNAKGSKCHMHRMQNATSTELWVQVASASKHKRKRGYKCVCRCKCVQVWASL